MTSEMKKAIEILKDSGFKIADAKDGVIATKDSAFVSYRITENNKIYYNDGRNQKMVMDLHWWLYRPTSDVVVDKKYKTKGSPMAIGKTRICTRLNSKKKLRITILGECKEFDF
jgi:hypothetical protein